MSAQKREYPIDRRGFLKGCSAAAVLWAGICSRMPRAFGADTAGPRPQRARPGTSDLVVCQGDDPYRITQAAVEAMGGMRQFVSKNSVVCIKPNIGWDRTPEQAANTNPQVVAALIDLCVACGARRVKVFDFTCNETRRCYANSGMQQMAQQHGALMVTPSQWDVKHAQFSYPSPMQDWPIFREALECDTFINVPVAKHHGLTQLTLSMKNLMGVCAGQRGLMHIDIGPKLVDLTDFIRPELTVIDAFRVLVRHGPQGGRLEDVEERRTVMVGTDPTLTDLYACEFMGRTAEEVPYLRTAVARGFGKTDIATAKIEKITA